MSQHSLQLPCYPARPHNAGPWPIAKKLRWFDEWTNSPKGNGWRAVVHTPTSTVFNRHGERLSIASEFSSALSLLKSCPFEWLDCEGLERRHKIGRGTLLVIDWIDACGPFRKRQHFSLDQASRRLHLAQHFSTLPMLEAPPENSVMLFYQSDNSDEVWDLAKETNARLGVEFYEGIVRYMKSARYPQGLNPERETGDWAKCRWRF